MLDGLHQVHGGDKALPFVLQFSHLNISGPMTVVTPT